MSGTGSERLLAVVEVARALERSTSGIKRLADEMRWT